VDNLEKPSSAWHLGLWIKSHQGKFRKGDIAAGWERHHGFATSNRFPIAGLVLAACAKYASVFTVLQFNGRAGSVRTTSGR